MSLFTPGNLIDERYEITGILGQGGTGQVYRAYDRHLDRDVALKALRPHLTEADEGRFKREIKALAKLSHPGIVSIYDLGRGEHVYFVMELVAGGLFTDLGPLEGDLEPLLTLLNAAISVCEALAYVHHHGMVHRDLTPRNILITLQGQPKVMDFGLVQLAEASRQLTRTGFTLGTPQYMAPEQAEGGVIGAHTDLYALGAVLYKTVTGAALFEAESDLTLLYQHVYGDFRAPTEVNPAVPPSLDRLISSLLAKDPAGRPTSGYRVAAALRTIRGEVARGATRQRLGGPGQRGVLSGGPPTPNALQRAWQVKLAEGPQWPAALTAAEGFLLLGTRSEEVFVLHPADGGVQARFRAEDEVNSPIVCGGERLYYTSRGGALSALHWPSGARAWEDEEAGATGLLPYAEDLFVAAARGLERRSSEGETRWRYDLAGDAPVAAPTLHHAQVCVVTHGGWLHSADVATGEGRFKLELGAVAAQPAAKNDLLLLPERGGDLHAFHLGRLEVLWTYDMEGQLWASPVLWGPYVYAVSWAGVMRCLSLQTGDDVWAFDVGAKVTAAPIVAGDVLYVATEEGEIIALDARSGQRLFADRVSASPIQASPLVVGETLVAAALDGTVRAYR